MNAFIAPVVAQSAITNPTMVITTTRGGVVVQALQAVVEKRDRFFRCDLAEVLHQIADRVRAGNEREQAGRDKERRGYGEECAVGECGGDHWHVVIERLLAGAPDDC